MKLYITRLHKGLVMAEKTERNPKGAGRPKTGIKRVSICISGRKDQIDRLKELADASGKTTSQFIFEKTGVVEPFEC